MKRICVLVLLAAIRALTAFAQCTLVEGFESATFPPSGWSLQFSGTQYWERATIGGYATSTASAIFRFYDAPAQQVQSLLTSTFAATPSSDSLSFDHAYATFDTEVDSLVIETSTDGGTSFSRLVALAGGSTVGTGMVTAPPSFNSFTPTSSQWATKSYALPVGTNKIRFVAKSAFGNNLYLDNIKVSQVFANDVGVAGIQTPRYFINLHFVETPRATIKNFGLNNQAVSFSTQMTITGPSGFSYSSSKTDTLTAGLSRTITFDPTFNPTLAGSYSVTCYTLLASDQSRTNDTARTVVTAGNYNYGSNGGFSDQLYYFTNSLSGNGAPAQPQFLWKDTASSSDLILNGVAIAPLSGDIDDGYFKIGGLFPGKGFRLFGADYSDSIFIGTNGIISFTAGFTDFVPAAIPSGTTPNAAIYPMWMDFDFSDLDIASNKLSYKTDGDILIITYTRAPRYNTSTDSNDFLTFQVCLRYSSVHTSNSFVAVQFDSAQSGSSFLAAYQSHSFAHLIGAENSSGTSAVTYRFVSGGAPLTPGPAFGSSLALTFGPSYASTVKLSPKAFFEGAYSTALHAMRTDLTTLMPLTQPYTVAPWGFAGRERVNAIPSSSVDWILIELRTSTAASSQAGRRAALMRSDGTIVDTDGTSSVSFDLMSSGSYYIVLSHRNHLSIMTSTAQSLSNTPLAYDFTSSQSQAFGTLPMNQLEAGVFGMVSGDANASTVISTADANAVFTSLSTTSYSSLDINMSGIITTLDANGVFGNLSRSTQVPSVSSTLPADPVVLVPSTIVSGRKRTKSKNPH
jgi:hypothetical protein